MVADEFVFVPLTIFTSLSILLLYFLPWIIAIARDHPRRASIAVADALLGWTIIGWLVALAWAVTTPARPSVAAPTK